MKYTPIDTRKLKKRNIQLKPWHYVIISLIVVLLAFLVGATLATKVELSSKTENQEEVNDNNQLNIVYNFLEEVKSSLKNQDTGKLSEMVKGNGFDLQKEDYKELVSYFGDKEIELNKFILTLRKQGNTYLSGEIKNKEFFYLDDIDGKLRICVNLANIEILVKTRITDIVTELDNGERQNHKIKDNKKIVIDGILPTTAKLKIEAGEWSEEYSYDFIDSFINSDTMVGYDTTLRTIAFKHGAGVSANVMTNVNEANLYINGKLTDIKIGEQSFRVDGLKEGDTLRAEYKGERSKEFKVRKENNLAELDFEIAKQEERFGLLKSDVDSGEVIAKNLLNTITNGVSSKDPTILKNVVDPAILEDSHNILNSLINKYNSLLFNNVRAVNAKMYGSRIDLVLDYSYESIDTFGNSVTQNGNMKIAIDLSSSKVLSFKLN